MERDPAFAHRLRHRFDRAANVRVILADARTFSLPRKGFAVIASIPYAISTALFRRLLGAERTTLTRAALIVEWGFARRVTTAVPPRLEQAWWAARFDIRLVSRVPARCFSPPPRVDSAHLVIERRCLDRATERTLWTLLDAAYRAPGRPAKTVAAVAGAGRNPHPALRAAGIDPARAARTVPPARWAALARNLRSGRPVLPRRPPRTPDPWPRPSRFRGHR
ncbi:MAG TPA: rRNA adenine N-6-methyltransferase family protein [Amycolatopsis sp.]|nr:rRNA adenine N-6-methyltransferase family protein [Amycolatopsis sp.]